MDDSKPPLALSPELQRCVVRELIGRHPLPWVIERDWTWEVLDPQGKIVAKCMESSEAQELIEFAQSLDPRHNREDVPCEPGEHTWRPEDREMPADFWDAVDPCCTSCGWASSDLPKDHV